MGVSVLVQGSGYMIASMLSQCLVLIKMLLVFSANPFHLFYY